MYFDKPKLPLADPADRFDGIILFDQDTEKKNRNSGTGATIDSIGNLGAGGS